MTDTTGMRRDFEDWFLLFYGEPPERNGNTYKVEVLGLWISWQFATECATAIERERCAVVCEALKIKALRLQTGQDDDLSNVILRQVAHFGAGFCAEIIRQGGDT